jgi:hypothetical protein
MIEYRTDTYKELFIPDEDMQTCLKVIRTIRNVCLHQDAFDADGAVILSHAHAKILDLWKLCETEEEESTEIHRVCSSCNWEWDELDNQGNGTTLCASCYYLHMNTPGCLDDTFN